MRLWQISLISIIILLFAFPGNSKGIDVKALIIEDYLKEATILYNNCKYQEAISLLTKALNLDLANKDIWYLLGRCYYKLGKMPQFITCYFRSQTIKKNQLLKVDTTYKYLTKIYGIFSQPKDIEIDDVDDIYIADLAYSCILKVDRNGKFIKKISHPTLVRPYAITIDAEKNIYVTDFIKDDIKKFSSEGKFLKNITHKDLKGPLDLEFHNDMLYVIDKGGKVTVFDKEGNFILKFPDNTLKSPKSLCIHNNEVVIWDTKKKTLFYFDKVGNLKRKIKLKNIDIEDIKSSSEDGKLYAIDNEGKIYTIFNGTLNQVVSIPINQNEITNFRISFDRIGLMYISDFEGIVHIIKTPIYMRVFIDRIITSEFPLIKVKITIHSGFKKIINLKQPNILLTEDDIRRPYPIFIQNLYKINKRIFILLLENNKELKEDKKKILSLVDKFLAGLNEDKDKVAVFLYDKKGIKKILDFCNSKLEVKHSIYKNVKYDSLSDEVYLLKATEAVIEELYRPFGKKYIILFTKSKPKEALTQSTLLKLKELRYRLWNNNISLYCIDFAKGFKNRAFFEFSKYFNFTEIDNLHKQFEKEDIEKDQYIIIYNSPSRKWSQEPVKLTLEAGLENFHAKDYLNYIIPKYAGISSEYEYK